MLWQRGRMNTKLLQHFDADYYSNLSYWDNLSLIYGKMSYFQRLSVYSLSFGLGFGLFQLGLSVYPILLGVQIFCLVTYGLYQHYEHLIIRHTQLFAVFSAQNERIDQMLLWKSHMEAFVLSVIQANYENMANLKQNFTAWDALVKELGEIKLSLDVFIGVLKPYFQLIQTTVNVVDSDDMDCDELIASHQAWQEKRRAACVVLK
jgi:hypothetical protein